MIPFNKPYMNGRELYNISEAHRNRNLSGDGPFTRECQALLSERLSSKPVFLTNSGTAALELALHAVELRPGDEVIVPSFTFVSCGNAVLLAGGVPVFADIDPETQGISLRSIKNVVSARTRVVMIVHYGSIPNELLEIISFCREHNLHVIEDAAHCLGATFNGQELGTFGDFGAFSFHETKNITCGEGGALVVSNPRYRDRIEIMREKGTDRSKFIKGLVDKYTWQSIGSSYLPSEISAAFLFAQLADIDLVTEARRSSWSLYYELLRPLEQDGLLRLPVSRAGSRGNGHIFYTLFATEAVRNEVMLSLRRLGIHTAFHYVPLHTSAFGRSFRFDLSSMDASRQNPMRLLRLPIWFGITDQDIRSVANALTLILRNIKGALPAPPMR